MRYDRECAQARLPLASDTSTQIIVSRSTSVCSWPCPTRICHACTALADSDVATSQVAFRNYGSVAAGADCSGWEAARRARRVVAGLSAGLVAPRAFRAGSNFAADSCLASTGVGVAADTP